MRLNGDSMDPPEENDNNNEMLETESRGVAIRVSDLERKVLEQGDELVCLKATLAEALRRLSILEGAKIGGQTATSPSTLPTTPIRNGLHKEVNRTTRSFSGMLRPSPSDLRRVPGSSLPQRNSRTAVHYQSTGSLHSSHNSDSHSSSSASPVPSPSPRATPALPPTTRRPPTGAPTAVNSSVGLHKRWSSTGDFGQSNGVNGTGSGGMHSRTKDASFNEDEKTVKIYLRGRPIILHAPTELGDNYNITKVATAPQQKLKLDWVYGYRGRDCRSNLYLLPTGEMVYFVAATVVLYNVEEQSQRHYLGHTDDVKSIAIHPNKMVVATGQCSGHERRESKAHIRVWNSVSLHTMAVIGMNEFDLSVCCLSFSKADGGALLLAVDEASDHNLSVWDWQKGENGYKVTETRSSVDTIVAAEFHPLERNTIVTCGKSHIAFWTLDAGGTLFKRMGIFEARDKPKYVTCVAFLQTGETITGDSNGNLAVWGRGTNTIWRLFKNIHEGAVFSICVLKDGSIITGGGKDGRLVQFDSSLERTGEECQVEGHYGGIRVISEGPGTQLLIGTTRNCILTGTNQLGYQPIILGHFDELWGLASHPNVQQFATAGYDKVLQLWDSLSHSILWSKDIGEQAQSVAFSKDGSVVLVGCLSGKWMVFDTATRDLLSEHFDGVEPIQVIQFSPDGTMLAVGSRDNHIYIYQVSNEAQKYSRVGRCAGHSSFVTHIDWANDNQTIRSNSGDYELLYWNAGTCRQIPQSSMMKDVEWATNTCILTFTTIGIWPENADGSDVNYCDRSSDKKLMATADDFGKVKLYSYPVIQPRSLCHVYGGHSSHVTKVFFLHDDTRLVSIGGKDTAVMQWTVS